MKCGPSFVLPEIDTLISSFGGHVALCCQSLSQSSADIVFELVKLVMVNSPTSAVGTSLMFVIYSSTDITISGLAVTLLFPVVYQCRIYLWTLSALSVVENLLLLLKLQ